MLPTVVWIASRPPVLPAEGITSTSTGALRALSGVTRVRLVTFADHKNIAATHRHLSRDWPGLDAAPVVVSRRPPSSSLSAAARGQFRLSFSYSTPAFDDSMSKIEWWRPDRLLVFDDILLAPKCRTYGSNAILSPHDCMSALFQSHARLATSGVKWLRNKVQALVAYAHERRYYHLALLVHVVTNRDRVLLERINPLARYHVIPNPPSNQTTSFSCQRPGFDVVVWADLRTDALISDTRTVLLRLREHVSPFRQRRIGLAGRVSTPDAARLLGPGILGGITYGQRLEDLAEGDVLRTAVLVVPDSAGAGMKNRCVDALSNGACLGCLYSQMEGLDDYQDIAAINAPTVSGLCRRIAIALEDGSYVRKAERAGMITAERRDAGRRARWLTAIERAVDIRSTAYC